MKKIVLLLSVLFLFNSCSMDDESDKFHYALLPIESVDIPAEFTLGETYDITIRYFRPSTCHAFDGFYYEKNLNTRTIAVQNVIFEQNNCVNLSETLVEQNLEFYVTNNGSYIFKFWQGKDATGEDIFLEYEIPVN